MAPADNDKQFAIDDYDWKKICDSFVKMVLGCHGGYSVNKCDRKNL